jgi:hypothetical protein
MKLPLQDFAFSFDDPETLEQSGEGIRIGFSGSLDDNPEGWQFQTRKVSARHMISVAIRRPRSEPLSLRFFQVRYPA